MYILSIVANTIAFLLLVASGPLRVGAARAVPGTHRKYMLTSVLILVLGAQALAWAVTAVADLHLNLMFSSAADIAFAVWACLILRTYLKQDNWFNDAGKRLKKRVRKFATLRVRVPRPAFSPSA